MTRGNTANNFCTVRVEGEPACTDEGRDCDSPQHTPKPEPGPSKGAARASLEAVSGGGPNGAVCGKLQQGLHVGRYTRPD